MSIQLSKSITCGDGSAAAGEKPVVVGIYGVSGCGKTFLLNQLKHELDEKHFAFCDGSGMIDAVVPGGLKTFQSMDEQDQIMWRQHAIDNIRNHCIDTRQTAIVAGHSMLWSEEKGKALPVYTRNDLHVYSHILYLDIPAEIIDQRRSADIGKSRPVLWEAQLHDWQQEEKVQLRNLCRAHGILFSVLRHSPTLAAEVSKLLRDFRVHTEEHNLSLAKEELDKVIKADPDPQKIVMAMDADRTLAAEDTGALFWSTASRKWPLVEGEDTLKTLFSGPLDHSYAAFRQATLLYEETARDYDFEELCQDVASQVTMYPEIISLLQLVAEQDHVEVVVISSGLRLVWEKVLEREGLAKTVKVIGGGRIADGFVVTGAVKAALVACLRPKKKKYIWAFGDAPVDLGMLNKADRAIVVVGEEQTRSKTMDAELLNAINNYGLRPCQVVLPNKVSPREPLSKLPLIKLTDPGFIDDLLDCRHSHTGLEVIHATDTSAAKLLATAMRNSAIAGPELRESHRCAGYYLAINFVADVVGLEQSSIQHVLGRQTKGHQLHHEEQTTIVALMRGGEPMAFGVNDAFPLAMFVHAKDVNDVKFHHLEGQLTLILVDSVINTGKTIINFVKHVRKLHASIKIVVVAGVIQARCVSGSSGGTLAQELAPYASLHIIALRLSDTSFVASRQTDTGNRLFNTTQLP
ncbi:MAG: hypothetical protein Q9166_003758 [cf. Caloplaca sp. 2 TL-2023]